MKKPQKTGGFPPKMNVKDVVIKGDISPCYNTRESGNFIQAHDIRQWKLDNDPIRAKKG